MEWKDKIGSFRQIDVRGIQGNFFQGIKKQAMQLPAGNGLEIAEMSKRSGMDANAIIVKIGELIKAHR